VIERRGGGGDRVPVGHRGGDPCDVRRIDERLVALDVDDPVRAQVSDGLRDTIRA
jgi:hypothetical protein